MLAALANSPFADVRRAVAGHPAAPPAAFRLHAHDVQPVRVVAAANPTAPPEVLWLLALDPDPDVRNAVARNPAIPPDVLAHWTSHERNPA